VSQRLFSSETMEEKGHHSEVVRLLMEHRSSLFAFILAIVRDYHVAEDVLQETSMAVCEASGKFQLGTNFGAWSREIARRRILAHNRSAARFPLPLSDEEFQKLEAGFSAAEEESEPSARMDALRSCIERLRPLPRRLLQLRYAAGFSLGEIGEQIDRQPESVRKTLYRARQILRQCIERRLRAAGGGT
jgi:RNA polymerase sigma-70 factor (ECF subfamily)